MDPSINNFKKELDRLLKKYLGDGKLNHFNQDLKSPKDIDNKIPSMINNFYLNQLQIETDNYNERIKIDRSITLSKKTLQQDSFNEFLLDLGHLCLSGGRLNLATEIFRKVKTHSSKTIHKAESLLGLADVFSRRADWKKSIKAIKTAEIFYRELNDKSGQANCANLLGLIFAELGDLSKAKDYFHDSQFLLNPVKDLELAASLDANLGIIENIRGNKAESIKHLTKALKVYKKLGNNKHIAETRHNLGMVYLESGDHKSALESFDEGIEIAKQGRFMSILCVIYLAKSQLLVAKKDICNAAGFADKALDISNSTDDKLTSADIYRVKGMVERSRKNYSDAETFLLNSLRMNKSLKNVRNIAETSFELGLLNADMGNESEKTDWLQQSLDYYSEINAAEKVTMIEELLKTNFN